MINHKFLLAFLLLLTPLAAFTPTEDGLYARFKVSYGSEGATEVEYTTRLFYDKTPLTVANFVGLVRGTQPWLDFDTRSIQQSPFYAGVGYHRVIKDFMIQGGSRNGRGTDNPGYRFPDEVVPGLTFNRPGLLAMANSGRFSNGSQFFITVVQTQWLNGKHTIFGEVVNGMEHVLAISNLTTVNTVPQNPVIMDSVEILAVGAAAQAFVDGNPKIIDLARPVARMQSAAGDPSGSWRLQVDSPLATQNYFVYTLDAETWRWLALTSMEPETLGFNSQEFIAFLRGNSLIDVGDPDPTSYLYQIYSASFPQDWVVPAELKAGSTLVSDFTDGSKLTLNFSSGVGGTYTLTLGDQTKSGTFQSKLDRNWQNFMVTMSMEIRLQGESTIRNYTFYTPSKGVREVYLKGEFVLGLDQNYEFVQGSVDPIGSYSFQN